MRKIIQIAAMPKAEDQNYSAVFALCDDGSVWQYDMCGWFVLPAISQGEINREPNP